MEAIYKRVLGPINPKKPAESLRLQIWFLKRFGLWPPETDNKLALQLYNLWAYFYRGFFLYCYTCSQILFFLTVEDLADVAEGFFLLLTQVALLYKVEKFYHNRYRLQACVKMLESSFFRPSNEEENLVVTEAMVESFSFQLVFLVMAHLTISSWAVLPLFETKIPLPIKAWYPFSIESPFVFWTVYIYQIFGISTSACFNCSTDTLGSAMIAQINSQVRRLGIQLSKIGHKSEAALSTEIHSEMKAPNYQPDQQMVEITDKINELKQQRGENYGELTKCVMFHEQLLRLTAEIQDIFKGPVFAQIFFSCIIICTTCFIIADQPTNISILVGFVSYLLTMITQILLFCWIGNEVIYSSYRLTERAYFSNFIEFDKPTARVLLIFMQRTVKDITVKAGGLFDVTLSLMTFMSIMKSSYSYFAVLQSMKDDK